MLKFLLLAVLLPAVLCDLVNHHPCTFSYPGNTPPAPAWVEVQGCNVNACNVPNGRATDLAAAFAPVTSHERLHFDVRVFLPLTGIEVPIEDIPGLENACELIEGGCPVTAGQGETVARMVFQQTSPLLGLTVRIEVNLLDSDTNQSVVCGGVSVSITAPE